MSTATPLPAYAGYKDLIVSSPSPAVAHVEINRPQKVNAFSRALWLEFGKAFEQLSADADIRAIVLSGAGEKGFTAGLDVQDAQANGTLGTGGGDIARTAKGLRALIEEFQNSIGAMEKCEKRKFCLVLEIDIALHGYLV